MAKDHGLQVEKREVPYSEVASMKEVGACGTAVVLTPVNAYAQLFFLKKKKEKKKQKLQKKKQYERRWVCDEGKRKHEKQQANNSIMDSKKFCFFFLWAASRIKGRR